MVVKKRSVLARNCAILHIGLLLVFGATLACAQKANDPLVNGFENPPAAARPRVWWHWMGGNISKDGIKLDLEWMNRAGIGGFQQFEGQFLTPKIVDKPLPYMSPEWKDAFKYANTLADQLGLEEAIASSPGWSETGGPWVPANEGMKKYVWSEIRVAGGKPFTGILPHPPTNTGVFQNLPVEDAGAILGVSFHAPQFYADSAVVAYKVASTDVSAEDIHPVITSSAPIDTVLLSDGDLVKATRLAMPKQIGDKAWIQYEFPEPQTIRAVTIVAGKKNLLPSPVPAGGNSGRAFEASDDGRNYRVIIDIPIDGSTEHTLSFAPVTAKYFRVTFTTQAPAPNPFAGLGMSSALPVGYSLFREHLCREIAP